jgi:hypothetical protein
MGLVVLLVLVTAALVAAVYILGLSLGSEHRGQELSRIRQESAQAERRIHDIARAAFLSMANAVERRRQGR